MHFDISKRPIAACRVAGGGQREEGEERRERPKREKEITDRRKGSTEYRVLQFCLALLPFANIMHDLIIPLKVKSNVDRPGECGSADSVKSYIFRDKFGENENSLFLPPSVAKYVVQKKKTKLKTRREREGYRKSRGDVPLYGFPRLSSSRGDKPLFNTQKKEDLALPLNRRPSVGLTPPMWALFSVQLEAPIYPSHAQAQSARFVNDRLH